jgi:uncharacterized membrane protein
LRPKKNWKSSNLPAGRQVRKENIQKLAQARDLLLPRLMSGEIDPVRYDKLSNEIEV